MRRRETATAIALGVALLLGGAGTAIGQQPAPSGNAMPAGHPPVGHPGGGEDDDDGDEAPHGARGATDPRFFNPPEDTAIDDASLPRGVIVVTIKDAQDKPVAHAPILLGILHSTVAKGDSRERAARDGDDGGSARFEGLAVGTGHSYRVTTTRGPATYGLPPFGLGDRAGKRVTLHAYDTSPSVDAVAVAMQGVVYVALREDSIQVEQLISVYNLGAVAWTPDVSFDLPKGWKAFNKQDDMGDARIEEVAGVGAALRGTFPPGRHDLDFRYQVPLDDRETQTLRIRLPPRVAQARVMAEASKTMGLKVTGFPEAQRTEGRDGKHLLVTEHQATRGEGGVPEIELTLSGLPTPGQGRWVAVLLAVLAFGGGLYYLAQRGDAPIDEDARGDLLEAREALLGELVSLERAFKSGEVGPKTYNRVRAALVDALARIVRRLDAAKQARAAVKSGAPGRRKAESST